MAKSRTKERTQQLADALGGGRSGAEGLTDALTLLSMLQFNRGLPAPGLPPDVGVTAPEDVLSGGVPFSRVTGRSLGGLPFTPNPGANLVRGVSAIANNARAARRAKQQARVRDRRNRELREMTNRLLEGLLKRQRDDRVGLGEGLRLPAARGGLGLG